MVVAKVHAIVHVRLLVILRLLLLARKMDVVIAQLNVIMGVHHAPVVAPVVVVAVVVLLLAKVAVKGLALHLVQ